MSAIELKEIVVWIFAGIGVLQLLNWTASVSRIRKGRRFFPRPYVVSKDAAARPDQIDASDQLRVVMNANFSARRVMSLPEYKIFQAAEDIVRTGRSGCRVFAQTSLGEVLQSDNREAHSAINSKRVDVLIISPQGLPVVAVEYQGGGHYQSQAAARDAVKKEALRRAGVDYVEVRDFHTPDQIRQLLTSSLQRVVALRQAG